MTVLKKIFLIATMIWLQKQVYSQSYLWATSTGQSLVDYSTSVAADSIGNTYMATFYRGTIDVDPGPGVYNLTSAGSDDICLVKYNPDGSLCWAKNIGSPGTEQVIALTIDNQGHFYITGTFGGQPDFDPGPGTAILYPTFAGAWEGFVAKYDTSGVYDWAKLIGGPNVQDTRSLSVDHSGNLLICGSFEDSVDIDPGPAVSMIVSHGGLDAYICKLDTAGSFLWARAFGGTLTDVANTVSTDGAGNVYASGHFYSSGADFDAGAGISLLSSAGYNDIFITKYDALGNFLWARKFGAANYDEANAMTIDNAGNSFITGLFSNTVDFDPGAAIVNLSSSGGYDIFLASYDPAGNYRWAKKIGGVVDDEARSLFQDGTGNLFITGYFHGLVDFNPGAGVANLSSSGGSDLFLGKYDSNGNYVSALRLGGTSDDDATCVSIDPVNMTIALTGTYQNTVDFDPTAGVANFSSTGNTDIFVAKYCTQPPSRPSAISGPVLICANTVHTYSVPAVTNASSYTWTLPGGWTGTSTINSITITAGISGGTISVRSSNTCGNSIVQTLNVQVSNPGFTYSVVNAYCIGNCNGQISIVPSGGMGVYTTVPPSLNALCAGSYNVTVTDSLGCSSTLVVSVAAPPPISTTQVDTICDGVSMVVGTHVYTLPGVYSDTLMAAGGCDSIVTSHIAILPRDSSYRALTLCFGQTMTVGENIYNQSGIYVDTLSGIHGCDSIISTALTVLSPISVSQVLSICAGGSIQVGSAVYQLAGVYHDTLTALSGCDSIITTTLNVDPMPDLSISVSGNILTATATASYQWYNCDASAIVPGETTQQFIASSSGSYAVIISAGQCMDTSACENITFTAIGDQLSNQWQLWPVPASDFVNISTDAPHGQFSLLSVCGQKLLFGEVLNYSARVDLSSLPSGLYLLSVQSDSVVKVFKIMVSH